MSKTSEKVVSATVSPVTEKASVTLRGALRRQRHLAEKRAAREAKRGEKKGTKVSRGVNFYSVHDVASNVRALRGDRATHFADQLDTCRIAMTETQLLLLECGKKGDVTGMTAASTQLVKLQGNAAHIEGKLKAGVFSEADADALDVAVAMQCVAMLRSFRIYVEENADETKAFKLGVITDEAARTAIRGKLAELLEVCVTHDVFPKVGKR